VRKVQQKWFQEFHSSQHEATSSLLAYEVRGEGQPQGRLRLVYLAVQYARFDATCVGAHNLFYLSISGILW
jgi:hypothetical protein